MKTIQFFSIILLLTAFLYVPVNGQGSTMENIKSALKSGNATALSPFFASKIDLILPDDEDHVTPAVATKKLSEFFSQYQPTGFNQKHETVAPNGAKCLIGILNTSGGNFRTTVLVMNGKIEEIVIEN